METLLSYHPRDLLLFSPRVYWSMVSTNNDLYWPLAILAPVAGLLLLWALLRPTPARRLISLGFTGVVWLFVTWSFLWMQYRSINWAAAWAVGPFVVQGLWLLLMAAIPAGGGQTLRHRRWLALTLVAWGTLLHPLGFVLDSRSIMAADTWLLFPDPLAVTSLGLSLGLLSGWRLALALPIPLLWSLAGGATLLGLGSAIGWGLLMAAVLATIGGLPLRADVTR